MSHVAQYAIAFFSGLLSTLILLFLSTYPSQAGTLVVLPLWILVVGALYEWVRRSKRIQKDRKTFWLLVCTIVAFSAIVSLTESTTIRLIFDGILGLCVIGIFLWQSYHEQYPPYVQKRFRRMLTTLWTFNAYALATFLLAFVLFFPSIPFWIPGIAAGFLFAGISYAMWRLYFSSTLKKFSLWLVLIGLIVVELFWTFRALPFGYLVLGLMLTWIWYIVQLLFRFHLSPKDVQWKEQRSFLLVNGVLFILFLFVVRWI